MAHLELLENEHFNRAFARWWLQDWSWEGLANKKCRLSLGDEPADVLGTLQSSWSDEKDRLIDFAGRKWTRFHLPPFDLSGNPCPVDTWFSAKLVDCNRDLRRRLEFLSPPDKELLKSKGLKAAISFADLRGVVFAGGFSCDSIDLVANFGSAIFIDDFAFSGEVIGRFGFAIFAGKSQFSGARFMTDVSFANSTFCGSSDFYGTVFLGKVSFDDATFSEKASFRGSTPFKARTSFSGANFGDGCDFTNCVFEDSTDFSETRFGGVPRFDQVKLHSDTDFSGMSCLGGEAPLREWWALSYLDRRENGDDGRLRASKRIQSVFWRTLYFLRWIPPLLVLRWAPMQYIRLRRDTAAKRYENAYRNLRRLAQDIGDTQAEGMFHALELQCHRVRTNARSLDRLSAYLYGWLSDYGQSMARPLTWLAASWVLVSGLYVVLFGRSEIYCDVPANWNRAGELFVSAGRQFLPTLFGSTSGLNQTDGWLKCVASNHELAFFFISLGQTLFFITCVTLFLIALRRRFQLRN